jgi:hypothetical protein
MSRNFPRGSDVSLSKPLAIGCIFLPTLNIVNW